MGVKKIAREPAHRCEHQRGKKKCGLPALPAPVPVTVKGKSVEVWMCLRCRKNFYLTIMPFVVNGRPVPIQRMKYYEDADGNMWTSDLVRFYLQGVEGITVNRVGQMDRKHIELWFDLTMGDLDAWAETTAKYEREDKILAGKAAVAAGDRELAALHRQTVIEMRREAIAAEEESA